MQIIDMHYETCMLVLPQGHSQGREVPRQTAAVSSGEWRWGYREQYVSLPKWFCQSWRDDEPNTGERYCWRRGDTDGFTGLDFSTDETRGGHCWRRGSSDDFTEFDVSTVETFSTAGEALGGSLLPGADCCAKGRLDLEGRIITCRSSGTAEVPGSRQVFHSRGRFV